jgi:hypothetical protein
VYVDPRAVRFAAWLTTAVLAIVLLTGSWVLLAVQAAIFAVGVFAGLRWSPYGLVYRVLVAPRSGPGEFEPAAPPRFAQGVGLAFAVAGTLGYASGLTALGVVATACALAAAFLNAAFGLCLGCELYLLIRRIIPPPPTTTHSSKGAAA